MFGNSMEGRGFDGLYQGEVVEGADLGLSVNGPQDDVAGQHCAQTRLDHYGLPSHIRVAGSKDPIGRHLDIQPFLPGRGAADPGQDAKVAFANLHVGSA